MALGAQQRAASIVLVTRFWRHRFFSTTSNDAGEGRQRILFLGTPQVAALVLEELLQAAALPGSNLEIAAIVSRPSSRHWSLREQQDQEGEKQPAHAGVAAAPAACGSTPAGPSRSGSGFGRPPNWSRHSASPVEQLALRYGIPPDRVLCPVSAKEPSFLEAVRRLRPTLAITAAYGAMLPQAFLDIPQRGTLNIHPSLLPRYRGAAPVQRALQDGCTTTGVSLVFTVMKCDAGPVLEQQRVTVPPDVQAPELSQELFRLGAGILLRQLPRVLSGEVTPADAAQQDEVEASYAPKIVKQECYLDFRRPALDVHNHVRAMAGWPGSRASLLVEDRLTGTRDPIELKVLRTAVVPANAIHLAHPHQAVGAAAAAPAAGAAAAGSTGTRVPGVGSPLPPGTSGQVLCTSAGELLVPCGDGSFLSILEVGRRPGSGSSASSSSASSSTPASKCLTAREFIEGLGRRRLFLPSRT